MPWHLSKSDPRKVYDSCHQAVCVCATAEQAAIIVSAVNGYASSGTIKLREPGVPAEKESAAYSPEQGAVTEHSQEVAALQTQTEDPCCTKHLTKALRSGALDTAHDWQCPKCGTDWHASEQDGVRHWGPDSAVLVIRT